MSDNNKQIIEELEAKLTARGAFEAARFGNTTPEGRRFCDIYNMIRELEAAELPKAA